jgi:hypothetical protein
VIPGSLAAIVFVLGLVPGFLFLKLTQHRRRPWQKSSLTDLLEVVAVGGATTGLAAFVALRYHPDRIYDAFSGPPKSGADLVTIANILAWTTAGAIAAAVVLGTIFNLWSKKRFTPSVWQDTLGRRREVSAPHVLIHMKDGREIDGVLHAYTATTDEPWRDIALQRPIRITAADGTEFTPEWNYLSISSEHFEYYGFQHQVDPGQNQARRRSRKKGPR